MEGLPAHLLGSVNNNTTLDDGILHNITVFRDRVKNSKKLSDSERNLHLSVINQVLAKWETPQRYEYITRAIEAEKQLESKGLMGFDSELNGFWSSVKSGASKAWGGATKLVSFTSNVGLKLADGITGGAVSSIGITQNPMSWMMNKVNDNIANKPQPKPQPQPQPQPQTMARAGGNQNLVGRAWQAARDAKKAKQQVYTGGGNTDIRANNPKWSSITAEDKEPQQQSTQVEQAAPQKWYNKKSVKIGGGVVLAALVGTGIYLATRKKKPAYTYASAPQPARPQPQPQQLSGVKHSKKQNKATDAKVVKHTSIKKVELK